MRRFALVAGLLALWASSCTQAAGAQAAGSHPTGLPDDAEIRRMLTVRVDVQKRATGIVVGVTGPGGHRIIAYGVRSLEDRTPVDGRTVYDIGSLTKVFTALLLAEDVQHGRLRLDEPVRDSASLPQQVSWRRRPVANRPSPISPPTRLASP